ncbi:PREDICTED: lipid droplet-associated hydrolase-like [Priapulus caudatus]|uniref:Lipid droplet-associated hydrolase n=1 Tax=Priapulus caudatus TaxID=37621 RepID=A0ABM1DV55_PRICU|nr:PREDICTED: lipid droplet-associated hydrolase-like [Priapulus caudatus]
MSHVYQFVDVDGIPTQVLRFGKLAQRPQDLNNGEHAKIRSLSDDDDVLVLVIPGNPGIIGYYEPFMDTLFKSLKEKVSVVGISHAGHVTPPKGCVNNASNNFKSGGTTINDVYSLEGQIKHKVLYIRRYVPQHVKLILVGHSIGAYILLKLLEQLSDLNVVKGVSLFPTIERMALSPQGSIVTPILRYLRWLAVPPLFALSYVPQNIREQAIRWYFRGRNVHISAVRATEQLLDKSAAQNSLYMANDEMQQVAAADIETIQRHLPSLIFYYGIDDHWCPVSYYQDMRELFPHGDIILCEDGIAHAFVLENGPQMALKLAQWLEPHVAIMEEVDSTSQ